MTDFDPNQFEAELRTLRAARPNPETLDKIRVSVVAGLRGGPQERQAEGKSGFSAWSVLRWLVPATATVACIFLLLFHSGSRVPEKPTGPRIGSAASQTLKADQVEIDRQLMTNFDAIARLPSGEPVRFRCEEWMDRVRVRDSAAGLVLERSTPRLEISPVRFETY